METFTKRLERLLCTRPLGCGCALFLLLSGILLFAPTLTKLILAPLALGAFALFLWFSRRRPEKKKRFSVLSVSAILLFLSCFSTFFAYNYSNAAIKEKAENGEQGNIVCYITETVYSKEYGSLCIARVQGLDGDLAIHCKILLSFEEGRVRSSKTYTDANDDTLAERIDRIFKGQVLDFSSWAESLRAEQDQQLSELADYIESLRS